MQKGGIVALAALLAGLAGCRSAPSFFDQDGTSMIRCESGEKLTVSATQDGRALVLSGQDVPPFSVTFDGGLFEDIYRGDGVRVWIDPEVVVTFEDGRSIGPCMTYP